MCNKPVQLLYALTSIAAESQAEDNTAEESPNPTYHNSEESHGYEDFPSDIQNNTTAQDQITPEYSTDSEEIPE